MNKRSKNIAVVLFLVLLTMLILWPVWKVVQLFQSNTRMYFKGCITATANLRGSGAEYVFLEIGRVENEYAGNPKFELKFQDGTILTFPDIDLSILYRLANHDRAATEFNDIYPLSSRKYILDGCSVVIAEQRVIQVNVFGFDDSAPVQIRTAKAKEWHAIRFSDDDLVDLFGKAAWMKDDWRH